ncbi:MAG: hypothetical protein M1813_002166 [Trichoglossum hirsutum]|nr:MAG: hypothetical protein M1813_002166 [Trichoglossum hirsutum]
MPTPFGFSIGDFVNSLSVIKDLIDALQDASGARADYHELVAELRGLERGLIAIQELNINEDQQLRWVSKIVGKRRFLAVAQAAAGCRQCINSFLVKIAKFQDLGKTVAPANGKRKFGQFPSCVSGFASIGAWRTNLRKIQWALGKDDVTKFREEVQLHASSIQMLLVTLQMSELSTQGRKQDSRNKNQQTVITTLDDKLDQNTTMLQTQSELLKSVRTSLIGFERTLNTRQEQLFHTLVDNITQLRSSLKQQNEIPPQVMLQRPVQLLDACGRLAPFHLEFINSSEAFLAVLKVRFKHAGLRKIEKREFALQERGSKRRLDLSAPWDSVFLPGQKVDMSMVFRRQDVPHRSCPSCRFVSEGHEEEDIECENCHLTYRRIEEAEERPKKRTRSQTTLVSSPPQLPTQLQDESDEISDFRRVYVIINIGNQQTRPASTPHSPRIPPLPYSYGNAPAMAGEMVETYPSFSSLMYSSAIPDSFVEWLFGECDQSAEAAEAWPSSTSSEARLLPSTTLALHRAN